jgi:hypothetical protein
MAKPRLPAYMQTVAEDLAREAFGRTWGARFRTDPIPNPFLEEKHVARNDFYGRVHPSIETCPDDRERDPFECLLALCRVMGLRYDVWPAEHLVGKWVVSVEAARGWPADFFGGSAPRHRGQKGKYAVVGSATPLDGLSTAISMAFSDLWRNCEQWRSIVRDSAPAYRGWFVSPDEEGPLRRLLYRLKGGEVEL